MLVRCVLNWVQLLSPVDGAVQALPGDVSRWKDTTPLLSCPLHDGVEAGQGHELGVGGEREAHRGVGGAADGPPRGCLLEQ